MCRELTGLEEEEKEEYSIWCSNGAEGRNHHATHCYFCMANLKGISRKNKHHVQYPDVPYVINLVPHDLDFTVAGPNVAMESGSNSESSNMTDTSECGAYRPEEDGQLVHLTQAEFNDLTQYLKLSKESIQLLGSRL